MFIAAGSSKTPYLSALPELQKSIGKWRDAGETVALVPTMGALHDGHLSLVRAAKARCDRVVTSIFINPEQFAPNEDFAVYPRTFEADLEKLATEGCDLVWAPAVDVMYPVGFATRIVPGGAAEGLETDFRPHFFSGVVTVCCKLFTQVLPDIAIFGEKDYQQLCVIQQMVRDLNLQLEIIGVETIRESDGLAMSSRNAYLSSKERAIAASMNRVLYNTADAFRGGACTEQVCKTATAALKENGFGPVDYVEIRRAGTLGLVESFSGTPCRVLGAAWLGKTRLIDNIPC